MGARAFIHAFWLKKVGFIRNFLMLMYVFVKELLGFILLSFLSAVTFYPFWEKFNREKNAEVQPQMNTDEHSKLGTRNPKPLTNLIHPFTHSFFSVLSVVKNSCSVILNSFQNLISRKGAKGAKACPERSRRGAKKNFKIAFLSQNSPPLKGGRGDVIHSSPHLPIHSFAHSVVTNPESGGLTPILENSPLLKGRRVQNSPPLKGGRGDVADYKNSPLNEDGRLFVREAILSSDAINPISSSTGWNNIISPLSRELNIISPPLRGERGGCGL